MSKLPAVIPRAAARALLCLLPLLTALIPSQAVAAASVGHAAAPAQPVRSAATAYNSFGLTREVFGYAYGANLGDPNVGYPSWNFNLLSTVAFFAIRVNNQGVLTADSNWTAWNSSALTGLVSTAHAHGAKVVVTLRSGGADLCGALYGATVTASQIIPEVQAKGVDGINIDYEGQLATCTNPNLGGTNYTNQALLTNLAKVLRQALDAVKPGYYLSIATYSGSASGNDGFFNIPDLNQYVDSFFVMAYDMDYSNQGHTPLQNCVSFCLAPVSPSTNYYWNDTTSMQQYSAVVGPGKVILGQPYYGRVACVSAPGANAMATTALQTPTYLDAAAAISSPDVRPGTYSINRDAADVTGVDRWDAWYDTAYGCWREMYWSDAVTLSNRYALVNQDNLRGVGIWTLSYGGGASELWTALQSYFVTCTNTTLTAAPPSPSLSGTSIQLNAGSSSCVNPRYEFWMQPPGGVWSIVQGYSPTATYTWSTVGRVPGVYHFSVWSRDMNSRGPNGSAPFTYDSYATIDYSLTTQPCTGMSASAAPAGGVVGNAITVTGVATGCSTPSYQFWMQPPGGAWAVVQRYSTNANFAWNTGGLAPGVYNFSVWARDASSLGTAGTAPYKYDAYYTMQYALGKPLCAPTTVTAAPASSANVGTPVTISATLSGACANPRYQFWIQPPGGLWTIAQAYSPNATFAWNTASSPEGTYEISVWGRDVASSSPYDSYLTFAYTLATVPCTGASASASPATPAASGTPITITATASGCPSPLYEFWMRAPGGSWTMVRSYSSNGVLPWSTTGLPAGTYYFSVWARDVSSPGTTGAAPYRYDAYWTFSYVLS